MAQKIKYFEDGFEDGTKYKEGPFVYCDASGYRIEVELKGHKCPVLPDTSIYDLLELEDLYNGKTNDEQKVIRAVNWLNSQVNDQKIICENGKWIRR